MGREEKNESIPREINQSNKNCGQFHRTNDTCSMARGGNTKGVII